MKKLLLTIGLIAILVTAASLACFAEGDRAQTRSTETTVTMSTIFDDNMVFQANEPINVFGYCEAEGATIKVTLGRTTGEATVSGGKWSVTLPAMEYRRGLTLTVEELGVTNSKPLKFKNVDIGEVWVLSGQSNGFYEFYKTEDSLEFKNNANNYNNIRVFSETKSFEQTEKNLKYGEGTWNIATSDYLSRTSIDHNVSGVAYVVATKLAAEFGEDVTIAIINTVISGSSIKAWLPPEIMEKNEPTEYAKYVAQKEYYEANGKFEEGASAHSAICSFLYQSEVKPYTGFTAKGTIWWQGESDCGTYNKDKYPERFSILRDAFRTVFRNEDMPFFVVQLHPYGSSDYSGVSNFRIMQTSYLASEEENTYVIASGYEGMTLCAMEFNHNTTDGGYVHNARKSPVALRVANAILDKVYGYYTTEKVVTAPEIVSIKKYANAAIITFDSDLYMMYDNEIHGFEIAGSNGVYYPANVSINGNVLTLTNPNVTSVSKVRYSYATTIVVLKDGTEVKYSTSSSCFKGELSGNGGIVITDTATGKTYRLGKDAYYSVRTRLVGNVTNASGIPLTAFECTVS